MRPHSRPHHLSPSRAALLEPERSGARPRQLILPAAPDPRVRLVPGLLSETECQALIASASEEGFSRPAFDPDRRDCERLHTIDPKLSARLLERLRPALPELVIVDGVRWRLTRFTHHWRYVHYVEGGHFAPHYDGSKMLPDAMTVFTVQIYLDQACEGGETRFYLDHDSEQGASRAIDYGEVTRFEPSCPPTQVIAPRTGLGLLFDHTQDVLHDGAPVRSGEKHILRGDLLYTALAEDQAALGQPGDEPRFWCPETAAISGTRSYVGEVWTCRCGKDDCGAHLSEPTTPQRPPARGGDEMRVILISGKRFSGKDHVAHRLGAALSAAGHRVHLTSLGSINKRLYAEAADVDPERLLNDRAFKERHRPAMVAHHTALNRENPSWCLDAVVEQAREADAEVLLISDLRTEDDLRWFQAMAGDDPVVLLRVESSDEARARRGWVHDEVTDALHTEVELDGFAAWTALLDNSADGDEAIDAWIHDTVIPRAQLRQQPS